MSLFTKANSAGRTPSRQLTGREVSYDPRDLIVSKTDTRGIITYANDVFSQVSGYTEEELIGAPHSLIRHPDMPRCVFKLLWDTISSGQEIFAYVLNRCKNGDHYWVYAHVTPTFGPKDRDIVGYHSSRRVPSREAINKVVPLYKTLLDIERKAPTVASGMEQSFAAVVKLLEEQKLSYEEFVLGL